LSETVVDDLTTGSPRVSVAIAGYNAERWIAETLDSVISQTMRDFEVVLVDDCSKDATVAEAEGVRDERIVLFRNERNLGQSATWNRAISLCRAPYVKFLCCDDLLRADCLERMLVPFEQSESVGMVFSRRSMLFDGDDSDAAAWRDRYEEMFRRFGPLSEVNHGRRLFETYLAAGFDDNWIGEPTNVMVKRSLVQRLGAFHPHLLQAPDMGLWLRLLVHGDVGFVDEPLALYRIHRGSLTARTRTDGSRWLDRLWLLESLVDDEAIRAAYPRVRRMARWERLRASLRLRHDLRHPGRLVQRTRQARVYLGYRLNRRLRGGATATLTPSPSG
jgi:glycosyltransferase involved in cell wall biosynthesis